MSIAFAHYTATDILLTMDPRHVKREDLLQALRTVGIPDDALDREHGGTWRGPGSNRNVSWSDNAAARGATRIEKLNEGLAHAIASMTDPRRRGILAAADRQKYRDGVFPTGGRRRLEALGLPYEILVLLGLVMDQTINVAVGNDIVTFRIAERDAFGHQVTLDISLGGRLAWRFDPTSTDMGKIVMDRELPATTLTALPGQPLTALFEHPVLGDDVPVMDMAETVGGGTIVHLRRAA